MLSGERQLCLQDEIATIEASREALKQENALLEEKVNIFLTRGH